MVWLHNVAACLARMPSISWRCKMHPVVEVSLIAYLWPCSSCSLPLSCRRKAKAASSCRRGVMGLLGAFLVVSKVRVFGLAHGLQLGHMIALPYAMFWRLFRLHRRYGKIPSDIVAGFCHRNRTGCAGRHWLIETTVWPLSGQQVLAILGLGLLPVGAAFYAWDFGMKHGDPMVLGASSYALPCYQHWSCCWPVFAVFTGRLQRPAC